jgi:ATP-dependent DNA helicase RecQ
VGLSALEFAGVLEHLGDEGIRMMYRRGAWNSREIENTLLHTRQHIQNRQKQLNDMVQYAETNDCRRKIILKHFGDSDSAQIDDCCDNCKVQKATPSTIGNINAMNYAERAGLIILDCIRRLKIKVGREKLAQILHGSHAQDVLKFHHDKNTYYGRLATVKQSDIKALIEQLVEKGYIKIIGGEYPILCLTPRGENAIQKKRKHSSENSKIAGQYRIEARQGKCGN